MSGQVPATRLPERVLIALQAEAIVRRAASAGPRSDPRYELRARRVMRLRGVPWTESVLHRPLLAAPGEPLLRDEDAVLLCLTDEAERAMDERAAAHAARQH